MIHEHCIAVKNFLSEFYRNPSAWKAHLQIDRHDFYYKEGEKDSFSLQQEKEFSFDTGMLREILEQHQDPSYFLFSGEKEVHFRIVKENHQILGVNNNRSRISIEVHHFRITKSQ